jgi:protocatechuate 3,4-dioxygenase beta subunit
MELHDDDKPVGRVLSRREVIKLLGGAGTLLIGGAGLFKIALAQSEATAEATVLPSCIVRPAMTEGPYFVEEEGLNRFDLRIDPVNGIIKEGTPLHLRFAVSQVSDTACEPLPGAQVDVWHCDALGSYSDVSDPGFDTVGQKWLRGYQITDENGIAEFFTIYPGWYSGRTVHIHFKIRTDPDSDTGYEFTSQLFFPEDVTDAVHAQEPYASKGYRDMLNADDGIYNNGGDQLLLNTTETAGADLTRAYGALQAVAAEDPEATPEAVGQVAVLDGYTAIFTIGLDLSQPAEAVGGAGGGALPGGSPPPRP